MMPMRRKGMKMMGWRLVERVSELIRNGLYSYVSDCSSYMHRSALGSFHWEEQDIMIPNGAKVWT